MKNFSPFDSQCCYENEVDQKHIFSYLISKLNKFKFSRGGGIQTPAGYTLCVQKVFLFVFIYIKLCNMSHFKAIFPWFVERETEGDGDGYKRFQILHMYRVYVKKKPNKAHS